jgi:hypothetical protein
MHRLEPRFPNKLKKVDLSLGGMGGLGPLKTEKTCPFPTDKEGS